MLEHTSKDDIYNDYQLAIRLILRGCTPPESYSNWVTYVMMSESGSSATRHRLMVTKRNTTFLCYTVGVPS
jgi:hypothetical protein